jgi:hypothetical protein
MAFYKNSTPDRQSRRAVASQDQGQLLPRLATAGVAPAGDTTLSTRNPPWGRRYPHDLRTFLETLFPPLIGADAVIAGKQLSGNAPAGRPRAATLSEPGVNLTVWLDFNLQQNAPVGQSTDTTELPPRSAARARDYSFSTSVFGDLIGTDAMNAGVQSDDLPPRGPARTRDYSFSEALFAPLIGADALATGEQSTDLPVPTARPRQRDYTWLQTLELPVFAELPYGAISQDLPSRGAPRSRDYSYEWTLFGDLIGQDAMASGEQSTELPPPAARRECDYTWTQSFALPVFGELPYGQSQQDLPAKAPRRNAPAFEPGFNYTLALDFAAQQVPPIGQSTAETELAPRTYARARDYTWLDQYKLELIGQDATTVGEQSFALPTPRAPRSVWFDQGTNFTVALDFVAQQIPPAGQTTGRTELPPRAYSRSRDYTFLHLADEQLIGQDAMAVGDQSFALPPARPPRLVWFDPGQNFALTLASSVAPVGAQSIDLPQKAAARARDYTLTDRYKPTLIGQDALPTGESTYATDNPPRGPARARDYTWLQTYPLYVYESLPPGQSTQETECPPKGPLRLKDYTYLHLSDTQLIGQDQMVVGRSTLFSDNLAPRAYPRARDYSLLVRFDLAGVAALTKPGKHVTSDRVTISHTLTDRALYVHSLSDVAVVGHTLED